ncbi:regulatory YrvL family protein [Aquibacillus rhizosphaerae]|uniref:Regulatory YrvL family protein n=1 Tax=Aquibacillus rhizosphaerae TaxID=3051431 RepID=A0ABT7L2X9_9BACI|nr:regulatory YrvL family protein [Aquibacillus sp. LR5S19]MDL4840218.1 regulatory YrvL family protein [Aquibacillus sp. LR5S19]
MSENKSNSFRDRNTKEKMATVVSIALLIVLVASFVLGLYFFGLAGIFRLLGVQYNSIWSLVLFVVSYFILGISVELFSKAIFKLSVQNVNGRLNVISIRFIVEALSNWLVLFVVDEFIKGITLSIKTEIVIALLFVVLEIVFDDDKD